MREHLDVVSVIVPVYNAEKYLDRCLKSILGQTYRSLEILLIDDGSTDSSLEIMNDYARQDSRIRVFHKKNGGVSSARNLGLEMMGGEYCTFVDSDDYVSEAYVERLILGMKERKADLAMCLHQSVTPGEASLISSKTGKPRHIQVTLSELSYWDKTDSFDLRYCWGACYRRSLVSQIRFDESLFVGEDLLFFATCLVRSGSFVLDNEKLYAYVQHSQSVCHTEYDPKKKTVLSAWKKTILQLTGASDDLLHSAISYYELMCTYLLIDIMHSPYKDSNTIRYLICEIRKNYKAVIYIPKEKRLSRIRVSAAVLFPRLTSHLIWCYYRWKERETIGNVKGRIDHRVSRLRIISSRTRR